MRYRPPTLRSSVETPAPARHGASRYVDALLGFIQNIGGGLAAQLIGGALFGGALPLALLVVVVSDIQEIRPAAAGENRPRVATPRAFTAPDPASLIWTPPPGAFVVVETPVDSRLRTELTEARAELLAANQTVASQLGTIAELTNERDATLAELDELAGQLDATTELINQRDTALTELAATRSDSLQARNDVQRLREEIARRDAEAGAKSERIGTFPDGAWLTQRPPQGSERVGSTIRMEVHSSEPPQEFARGEFSWQVEGCRYGPRGSRQESFYTFVVTHHEYCEVVLRYREWVRRYGVNPAP